jgi:hypothetical protein
VAIETTHSLAEICKVLHVSGSSVPSGSLQSLQDKALHASRGLVCRQTPTLDWYRVEEHSWVILQQNKVHRIHCVVQNVFSLISLKETQCALSIKLPLFQIHSYAAYNLVTQINMVFEEGNNIEQEHITICSCSQSSSRLNCFYDTYFLTI